MLSRSPLQQQVQLLDQHGESMGQMTKKEAYKVADRQQLKLLEIEGMESGMPVFKWEKYCWNAIILNYIDGLMQDCSISIALAMEVLQSCTEPLMFADLLSNNVFFYLHPINTLSVDEIASHDQVAHKIGCLYISLLF